MSEIEASRSPAAKQASLSSGIRIRLTTKPGLSAATIAVFPVILPKAFDRSTVASFVATPRMSSSRGMVGTGLKTCMSMKRDGCETDCASWVMEMEDGELERQEEHTYE